VPLSNKKNSRSVINKSSAQHLFTYGYACLPSPHPPSSPPPSPRLASSASVCAVAAPPRSANSSLPAAVLALPRPWRIDAARSPAGSCGRGRGGRPCCRLRAPRRKSGDVHASPRPTAGSHQRRRSAASATPTPPHSSPPNPLFVAGFPRGVIASFVSAAPASYVSGAHLVGHLKFLSPRSILPLFFFPPADPPDHHLPLFIVYELPLSAYFIHSSHVMY